MHLSVIRVTVLWCALASTTPALAQQLGRLFMGQAERVALERWRAGGPAPQARDNPAPIGVSPPQAESAAPPRVVRVPAQVLEVNGIVTRSGSGRSTTWINSVPYQGNGRIQGNISLLHGRSAPRVALTLGSGKTVLLKPGQSVDVASGRVREPYQRAPVVRTRQVPADSALEP